MALHRGVIVVLVAGCMTTADAFAAPADNRVMGEARVTHKGLYRITVEAPTPIPTNRFQALSIAVTAADGKPLTEATLAVSASMPQHGHGMLVQPRVSRQPGSGKFLAEGLKFHMPGYWEVKLSVTAAGQTDDLMFALDLQ